MSVRGPFLNQRSARTAIRTVMPCRGTRCLVPEEEHDAIPAAGNRPGGRGSSDQYPHTMIEENGRHVKENPSTHKM